MNKNLQIVRYGIKGEGIALLDNKVVFVPFAIKDEIVDVDVIKNNKSYYNSKLKNILTKSKNRTKSVCPYYYNCGGCNLQHIKYNEQLKIKKEIVKNNLSKFAGCNFAVNDVIASDKQFYYRNHISFHVNDKGQLGFYKENSNDFVTIKKCFLADETINKCIDIFNSYFFDNQIHGYNQKTKQGTIKLVDLKFVNNQLLITIVSTKLYLDNIDHLFIRLNLLKIKYGVYISLNTSNNFLIYGEKLKHIYGIKEIETVEENIKSYISSYSFLQINNYIKSLIYNDILKNVEGDVVVDLYSGRGVLASLLSKKAKKVYAIEIVKDACNDANNILKLNNIQNVDILCGDVQKLLPTIKEKIECVIIDPPRKGASLDVLLNIISKKPTKIIYLSCASNTLARDLKILLNENNYKIKFIQPYDMFPNTSNIETLVVLEKNENKN